MLNFPADQKVNLTNYFVHYGIDLYGCVHCLSLFVFRRTNRLPNSLSLFPFTNSVSPTLKYVQSGWWNIGVLRLASETHHETFVQLNASRDYRKTFLSHR